MRWLPTRRDSGRLGAASSGRLAGHSGAASTQNERQRAARHSGAVPESRAFPIREGGTGAPRQAPHPVFPLLLWRGMKEILSERHIVVQRASSPESVFTVEI